MTQDRFLTDLIKAFVERTQNELKSMSAEDRAHVLGHYAISPETADLCKMGIYAAEHGELLHEIADGLGLDLPPVREPALIIPAPRENGEACFILASFRDGRPADIGLVQNPPAWINPHSAGASATYITEDLAEVLALTDVGQSAVYVPLTETDALDVAGLGDLFEAPHDFIVTRDNWNTEQNNLLRLRTPRRDLGAILSEIGREQSDRLGDSLDNYYTDVWKIHAHDLKKGGHELEDGIKQDLVNLENIREKQAAPTFDPLDKVGHTATFGTVHDTVFTDYIRELSNRQVISTGLDRLDKDLGGGIAPGSLYVLGAAPSTGKTSLCVQLADEIVLQGYNVLFVSLEQNETELIAKTISRQTFKLSGYNPAKALTTGELLYRSYNFLDGANAAKLATYNEAVRTYHYPVQEYDYIEPGRMFIIRNRENVETVRKLAGVDPARNPDGTPGKSSQGLADIYGLSDRLGVADLRELIEAYAKLYEDDPDERKRHPVVFIDYLQIMKPEQDGLTDKQNADLTISGLRRIVADFGVSLFAISSLNRSGYSDLGKAADKPPAPTMANLKESGGIEYAADVVLVLYDAEDRAGKMCGKCAKFAKRQVFIKPLKNRNGPVGTPARFNYYPAYNLFSRRNIENPADFLEIEDDDPDGPM